jgi:hypothetical protein
MRAMLCAVLLLVCAPSPAQADQTASDQLPDWVLGRWCDFDVARIVNADHSITVHQPYVFGRPYDNYHWSLIGMASHPGNEIVILWIDAPRMPHALIFQRFSQFRMIATGDSLWHKCS